MDEPELLARLPERRVVEVGGARIGMVHVAGSALGPGERLARAFPDCDAVIYAHTHVPEVSRLAGMWILNPGSPTERRSAPAHSLLVLDVVQFQGRSVANSPHFLLANRTRVR